MSKDKSNQKEVLMKVDPHTAKELKEISGQVGASTQDLLASLVWLARKAMGRKIKIESKEESKSLTVTTFEGLPKISPLDKQ
jgi:hypothetical protein